MAPKAIIDAVSLDTQAFVTNGFCFNSKPLQALRKLIAAGRLTLVMTDITISEVRSRIRKTISEELLLHRQFVNKANALHNCSLPEAKALVTKLPDDTITQNLLTQFDSFIHETKTTIVSATSLNAKGVFEKYFAGDPPFGDAQNKKSEFPDAFAIQALGEWADNHNTEMFVISEDELFRDGCKAFTKLHPHSTLPKALDEISSDDEQLAVFLRTQASVHLKYIEKSASQKFEELGFWVEDEDGDAEVEVMGLTLDGDPEILEIEESEAVLQFNFHCDYEAELSYDDSATASYDEGDLVYVEHRDETVKRANELEVEVRVSFDRKELDEVDVIDISLTSPAKGFGIETRDTHGWPYK